MCTNGLDRVKIGGFKVVKVQGNEVVFEKRFKGSNRGGR